MPYAAELTAQFLAAANPEKARHLMRFFKTGEGQYGHGDQFLGLPAPVTRALVKPFVGKLSLDAYDQILDSPWHEVRLLGTWQGIHFCEFDGPRERQYHIKVAAG